jgi:hypothetical protein
MPANHWQFEVYRNFCAGGLATPETMTGLARMLDRFVDALVAYGL